MNSKIRKENYSSFFYNTNYIENKLGPYLAGLIEGDGHIYVPTNLRNSKGEKNVPSIEIAFDIKDKYLLNKIKDVLGGGYILIRKNNKSGRLFIKKKTVLLKLINLINGYMRTPKIEALYRLIDWFNNENNYTIKKEELDISDLDKNSWLSGFIEADGNFYLKWEISEKSKSLRPIKFLYYMRLSQKQIYTRRIDSNIKECNLNYMTRIAEYLKTSVIYINRKRMNFEENSYLVRTDKLESKEQMFFYFNKYPLFGYKYFAESNLEKIHFLIRNSEHKTEKGKLKLIEYTQLMKYNEVLHTWEHLDKFYIV
jgi:hypothetical protein